MSGQSLPAELDFKAIKLSGSCIPTGAIEVALAKNRTISMFLLQHG